MNVDLARVEFAFVTINHFFFVPVTIGLAFLLTIWAATDAAVRHPVGEAEGKGP